MERVAILANALLVNMLKNMELQNREVTLKLRSRPLRCVYLIQDREELLDAVTLYTHMWGGFANAILPMPSNDEEFDSLKSVLKWMNPDCIFTCREQLPSQIAQMLDNLPVLARPISKVEIQRHVSNFGRDLLHLVDNGSLSHIAVILSAVYPNRLENSEIRLLDANSPFKLEIALHVGLPEQQYRNYLVRHLGASVFSHLENSEKFLKLFLTTTKFSTPALLTLSKTRRSYDAFNSYLREINDDETLCIFLDDSKDLGIATAFWNCRWISPYNKIFMQRDIFLQDIRNHVTQIIEFMPYIRALHITTPFNREEALSFCNYIRNAFQEVGKEVLVKVNYRDFSFDWAPGTLSFGEAINTTRVVTSEGRVRFDLHTPSWLENTDFAFGYDAQVRFLSGRKFFSSKTLTGSRLLTNDLWRLQYSEENKDNLGELWLKRSLPVRAAIGGITGVALPGKECSFLIHPDNIVITQHLKDSGFEVKPNDHTRYAQGLVKRLGEIEKVASLIWDGGADIISVLSADRADQEGLDRNGIISALIKKRGYNHEDAQKTIDQKLKLLLSSELLRRGYSYKCQNCNLSSWLSLEELREFIECKGCVEKEQLPLGDLKFSYKPNELAAQLVREGGLAVLITAVTLRKITSPSSGFIQFGGDFLTIDKKNKFAEVDLFWLTEEALIISECKSLFVKKGIDEGKIQEKIKRARESLRKNLDIAKLIGAGAIVLGVYTNLSNISGLLDVVSDIAETAKANKIGLHLALNGKIYLWGQPDGVEPRTIRLDNLLINEELLQDEWSVGESPNHYGGRVGSNGLFDKEVLERWESELKT